MSKSKNHRWSTADDRWLTDHFPTFYNEDLAAHFGTTVVAIKNRAVKLKLTKHPQWVAHLMRFPNKGQFQYGRRPFNEMKDGDITTRESKGRKSKWIRVAGKWVQLQHHIWREAGNTIPKGYALGFIDKDPTNCALNNLQLRPYGIVRNERRQRQKQNAIARQAKAPMVKAAAVKKEEKLKRIQVERQWERQRMVSKTKQKVFQVKLPDLSGMTRVQVDHKTSIYIKPGQDPQAEIKKYLARKTA